MNLPILWVWIIWSSVNDFFDLISINIFVTLLKMAQKSSEPAAKKPVKDVVHQDRNWVTRIHDELNSN